MGLLAESDAMVTTTSWDLLGESYSAPFVSFSEIPFVSVEIVRQIQQQRDAIESRVSTTSGMS